MSQSPEPHTHQCLDPPPFPTSTHSHQSQPVHAQPAHPLLVGPSIHSPKLLVLDEPFVGLDPKASHKLKLIMAEHCKKGGAIFFSTHVLEVAEKLCHKVAIIKDGQLVKSGTMDEVKGDSSLENVFLELEGENA